MQEVRCCSLFEGSKGGMHDFSCFDHKEMIGNQWSGVLPSLLTFFQQVFHRNRTDRMLTECFVNDFSLKTLG